MRAEQTSKRSEPGTAKTRAARASRLARKNEHAERVDSSEQTSAGSEPSVPSKRGGGANREFRVNGICDRTGPGVPWECSFSPARAVGFCSSGAFFEKREVVSCGGGDGFRDETERIYTPPPPRFDRAALDEKTRSRSEPPRLSKRAGRASRPGRLHGSHERSRGVRKRGLLERPGGREDFSSRPS